MAKVYNYIVIVVGLWVILNIMGVSTTGSFVAEHLGLTDADSLTNITGSAFWLNVLKAFGALFGASVAISFFTKSFSAIPVAAGLASAVLIFAIVDVVALLNTTSEPWIRNVMLMFIAPFAVGYILALWDWARGMD